MTFFGNFTDTRPEEIIVEKSMVMLIVRQFYRREDFPEEIFVALEDSTIVSKGDVVWANLDNEHPYDFIALPRIDELVVNLPSKEQFLTKMGVDRLDKVTIEAENEFWGSFPFEFSAKVGDAKLIWE